MVNTSKILTVSYGTFSCTLEGFDDSFGTMKAIAEYFRDLTADDRYFGAEPPSPDAEMLARIAEREIARRVEAHREDNTFVLRAAEAEQAERTALPAADTALKATEAAAEEAQAETANAAIADVTAPPAHEPREEAAPEDDEVEGLAALIAESHEEAEQEDAAPAPAPVIASAPEAEEEADENETTDEPEEAIAPAAPAPQASSFDPDSVAAKLQRIRDVVSQTGGERAEASDYSEDEHAADLLSDDDATEDFLADAQADISAAFAADDAAEEAQLATPEAESEPEPETDDDSAYMLAGDDDEVNEGDEDDIGALLDKLSHADKEPETDLANDAPQPEAFVEDDDDFEENEDEGDLAAVEEPEQLPVRARVIKMKRTEFEAALAEGVLEEDDDEAEEPASSLSAEDEADLMRELAAVEAEFSNEPQETAHALDEEEDNSSIFADLGDETSDDDNLFEDEGDDEDSALISQAVSGVVRAERSAKLHESGADEEMGRIFEETKSKLDEDEGRGRRTAIAHLRAAVQATQAERDLGGDIAGSGPDTLAYRDDLETVVRPRRPAPAARTPRPETRKPAPLKLVAEQRIDTPKSEDPVRPRRVRAADARPPVSHSDNGDFAEYIESVGAQNLGEVLEAAASYMSFVEGVGDFSRPELMSKLSVTDHADTSREDRLRSFGQLLRAGKIRKLGQGRFKASSDISYQPATRAAGA